MHDAIRAIHAIFDARFLPCALEVTDAFTLAAAKEAPPGVADLLAKIGKGEMTGEYTVTGAVELSDYAWLVVEQLAPKNRPDMQAGRRPACADQVPLDVV